MGEITLLTGGVRSGKSYHAEQMAGKFEDVAYIATSVAADTEMEHRIAQHQKRRPAHWTTYETPLDAAQVIAQYPHQFYLIDCITVFISNLLLRNRPVWDESEILSVQAAEMLERMVEREVHAVIRAMKDRDAHFAVVTNEVGMSLVPPTSLGRVFRDAAGAANRMLASNADRVYLCVCGIMLPLKTNGE